MPTVKSVVISCAGVGSRLGLATTKALINLEGRSLIAWQLDYFKDVEDLRIVVGYQSKDVIDEVMKYRNDAVFVYNHNYFETKTGASFYLGARDAGGGCVIEYDGDLVVHPDDIKKCLEADYEYAAYSEVTSGEPMFASVGRSGEVAKFSYEEGNYEWTGPLCIKKDRVKYTCGSVADMLEDYLPMRGLKIRACDIDTYEDYLRAALLMKKWYGK